MTSSIIPVSRAGGEKNTASNVGAGEGIGLPNNGIVIEMKTITAGVGVTLTPSAQELQITADTADKITGPLSSTDNAIARYDGVTGQIIQNSLATLDDAGNMITPGDIVTGSGSAQELSLGSSTIENSSTGVFAFDELAVGGNLISVDIGAGSGHITNIHDAPSLGTFIPVSWAAQNLAIADLNDGVITYIYVDSAGTVQQHIGTPTAINTRERLYLGTCIADAANVVGVGTQPFVAASPTAQLADLYRAIGTMNQDIIVGNSGVNLAIATGGGGITTRGGNFGATAAQRAAPNDVVVPAADPIQMQYVTETTVTASVTDVVQATALTGLIDPLNYDNGGLVTGIGGSNNQATIQYLYISPNGVYYIHYGQTIYPTLDEAVAAINTDALTLHPALGFLEVVLLTKIAIIKGATNLSIATEARFFPMGKFGETSSGGGGQAAASTLQQGYTNGDGIILTDGVVPVAIDLFKLYKSADLPSASTLILATGNYSDVTGTATISNISARGVGFVQRLHFDDILALNHNGPALILPTGSNIITATGDEATFIEYDPGNWRCIEYMRADGSALSGGGDSVNGPATNEDEDIARFDGVNSKTIQAYTSTPPKISDEGIVSINNPTDASTLTAAASKIAGGQSISKSQLIGGNLGLIGSAGKVLTVGDLGFSGENLINIIAAGAANDFGLRLLNTYRLWTNTDTSDDTNIAAIALGALRFLTNGLEALSIDNSQTATFAEKVVSHNLHHVDSVDPTREMVFNLGTVATATIRTLTVPNKSGTIALLDDVTSPSAEFVDTTFRIFDGGDTSKKLAFEIASITTGTTRILTAPDKSGTVALLDDIAGFGPGDVTGPAAGATDEAIARYDGLTGNLLQDYVSHAPTIDDNGNFTQRGILNILDPTDATKKLSFDISAIATATTRTLTAPDASGVIALTSDIIPAPVDSVNGQTGIVVIDTFDTDVTFNNKIICTDPTESTSPTTGATVVTGGVGVGGNVNVAGDLTLSGAMGVIQTNTLDGSDTKSLIITAGGASASPWDRSAYCQYFGNEHANAGRIQFAAGNGGGDIDFYAGAATSKHLQINGSDDKVELPLGQLKYPVTQNPSADANTLDDIEKGNWTPSIADASLDGTGEGQVYGVRVGRYHKIGRTVFWRAYIYITNLGTLTGADQVRIVGYPYPSSPDSNSYNTVECGYGSSLAITAGQGVSGFIAPNTTYASMYIWKAGSGSGSFSVNELSVNGELMLSGHYDI